MEAQLTHLAVIMDGNRRWQKLNNNTNIYNSYQKGTDKIEEVIKNVIECKIPYLTIYAFSYENWQRKIIEIAAIMNIGREWLKNGAQFFIKNNIRCKIIGNRALLPYNILQQIEEIEEATAQNTKLKLQIAISYGGRDEIIRAFLKLKKSSFQNEIINEKLFKQYLDTGSIPDPDLLIRTGGQKRLSNYMLWQMAYTELCFLDTLWPDFSKQELITAIEQFKQTDRRYGRL